MNDIGMFVADTTETSIVEIDPRDTLSDEQCEAIAALIVWARSIIEPPAEVKAAMDYMRMEHASGVAFPSYEVKERQRIITNWTLKIFEEVQYGQKD